MTQSEKEKMLDLLRGHMPQVPAVEEMLSEDVRTLEPFVDALVRGAEVKGMLEAYFVIIEDEQRRARVAAKFDRVAMDETYSPF